VIGRLDRSRRVRAATFLLVMAGLALVTGWERAAGQSAYGGGVLADGPVGYWRLGEASGTSAVDASGNGLAGTYQGGVTLGVPGALRSDPSTAARLDGVNDKVSVPDPASGALDFGTGDFSVEFWLATSVNGEQAVIGKRSSGPYWQVTVTDDGGHVGALRVTIFDGAVTRQVYGAARVDDGAWHHAVVLFDRDAGITVYVDGATAGLVAAPSTGNVSNSAALQIGKISGYKGFTGDLDEIAVYPSLLAGSRVQAHFATAGSDGVAPTITLTSPADGSSTSDATPTFAGTAGTAPGDAQAVTVTIFPGSGTGGTPVQTLSASRSPGGAYSVAPVTQLAAGTYTARAEQSDTAGNTGLSAANTFTVVEGGPAPNPVLVGAGDIASCGMTGQDEATADLLDRLPDATVFTTGDNVYSSGSASEYADCYHPTWGRAKSRTFPSPGNHDYTTPEAAGYYGYFGAAAGDPTKGYYSYDLGAWHVIALNSNCYKVGGCDPGSPQEQWLRADLAAHPADCTVAYWHHPRFSSGSNHGNDDGMQPLWQALYDHGADLVLNGHEHLYERFLPQSPTGARDESYGITQITVGTGGYVLYPWGAFHPNSFVRNNTTFGVLKLTLHADWYEFEFVPVAGGTFTDSGTRSCHGAPGAPPPLPPPPDTTPPAVTLATPPNGSSTSDRTPLFSGSGGTASGDEAAITVEVYEGTGTGGALTQTLTATRAVDGSFSVEAAPLPLGTYTAVARQADTAGNVGRSAANTFTVADSPAYASAVLAHSPRAYWRLGEVAGTTAADEAGASPGAYSGGVSLGVPGALPRDANTAARFDGVNDLVSMGDPASGALDFGAGDFTVEAWVKTTVNGERGVVGKRGASGPYWQVTVTDDSGHVGHVRANVSDGAVSRQVYGPAIRVDDGAWHHVAVAFDRDAGTTVYVDGASLFTPGAATGDVSNAGAFGVGKFSSYSHFQGDIDEVAVYPSALSAAQIRAHYDAGRA
jgi:hypothetical protein